MATTQVADKPDTTTVVVNREFAKQVKAVADHREITMSEALERFAGASILREYRKVLDEQLAKVTGG